jgi:hypothetical protein
MIIVISRPASHRLHGGLTFHATLIFILARFTVLRLADVDMGSTAAGVNCVSSILRHAKTTTRLNFYTSYGGQSLTNTINLL